MADGEYTWGKRACRVFGGAFSGWAVGGGGAGNALPCGSYYPDYADSFMSYGPFSLADAADARLSGKLWLKSEDDYDKLCAYASIDGLNYYGNCASGMSNGWLDWAIDLTNVYMIGNLTGESQVWVALRFHSDYAFSPGEGAYVDDIVLAKCVGCALPAVTSNAMLSSAPDQTTINP